MTLTVLRYIRGMSIYKQRNIPNANNGFSKNCKQGYIKALRNPDKHIGGLIVINNKSNIIYRSSLEFKACLAFDASPKVVRWASEPDSSPFPIRYYDPFLKKWRNYYPDMFVEMLVNNIIIKYVVEIKPLAMLMKPAPLNRFASKKQIIAYNNKLKQIIVNLEKKKAAEKFCAERGLVYLILTEKFFENL